MGHLLASDFQPPYHSLEWQLIYWSCMAETHNIMPPTSLGKSSSLEASIVQSLAQGTPPEIKAIAASWNSSIHPLHKGEWSSNSTSEKRLLVELAPVKPSEEPIIHPPWIRMLRLLTDRCQHRWPHLTSSMPETISIHQVQPGP